MNRIFAPAALAALLCLPGLATATTESFIYPDFSNPTGLQINGNAIATNGMLRLTPAVEWQGGSVFSSQPITMASDASFSTFFSFQILNRGGLGGGADGLTFTIQTNASTVGGTGGGIGYAGIPNSLTVEFDTYDNGEVGGSNHVGINLNGDTNSVASTGPLSPDFDNGEKWYAWVDYNGATGALQVRWSDSNVRPADSMLSYTLALNTVLGSSQAFVGFTSGTGAGWGEHDVLSWSFINEFQEGGAPPIPEPGTYGLMALGLLAVTAAAKRRARG